MPLEDAHPIGSFEREVHDARRRAVATVVALGLTAGSRAFTIAVRLWQLARLHDAKAGEPVDLGRLEFADTLARFGELAQSVLFVVTAVLFMRWLWLVIRVTRALGGRIRWKPSNAIWAFVIPLVCLWEPYQILRDVVRELAPEKVPEPLPRLEAHGSMGYREGRLVVPPPRLKLPAALVGVWWTSFLLQKLPIWIALSIAYVGRQSGDKGSYLEAQLQARNVAAAVGIASAIIAIRMVLGVTARLAERFRRLRHNPPHVLRDAGIDLVSTPPAGEGSRTIP